MCLHWAHANGVRVVYAACEFTHFKPLSVSVATDADASRSLSRAGFSASVAGRLAHSSIYYLVIVSCFPGKRIFALFAQMVRHHAATHLYAVSTCSRHMKMNIGPMHTYLVSISMRGETIYRFYCTKQFGFGNRCSITRAHSHAE